jgi:quercetin dioxygenase-like cupin family protein
MEPTTDDRFVWGAETPWVAAGDGVRRRVLARGPDLMLVRVAFGAGAVGETHSHPHRQVTYVLSGRFEVEIDGERRVLEAGDSFFAPGGVVHGVTALVEGELLDVFTPARREFIAQPSATAGA